MVVCFVFFFFQAEDGIRDLTVTGVQTCALPICLDGEHPGDPAARPENGDGRNRPDDTGCEPDNRRLPPLLHADDEDRKSVVWGKSVDLGGRRIIKKKKKRSQEKRKQ